MVQARPKASAGGKVKNARVGEATSDVSTGAGYGESSVRPAVEAWRPDDDLGGNITGWAS